MTDNDTRKESHITADRSTIREWADETDAEPVRHRRGDRTDLALLPRSEHGSDHERVDWDAFFDDMERDDRVVVAHGDGRDRSFQVLDQDDAVHQSSMERDELTSSIMEGETVTTEVTETTVVEETIVEHADIESELIDRSTVSETIMDAELVSRELGDCNVEGLADHRTMHDAGMFDVGHSTEEDFAVTVEADEVWAVTKEVVEQAAIESRVVDRSVEESTDVKSDTIESRIELGDVERTVLDSGILDSSKHDVDTIDEEAFRSEYTDDDAIITEFVERKTVEEEMTLDREFSGTIDAAETRSVHDGEVKTIDVEMATADEYDVGEMDVDAYDRSGTTAGGSVGTATDDAGMAGEERASSFTIDESDQGKTVVDQSGDEVGIVSEVTAGTLYVDPHPSLTDKIRAKLDWGDKDEESYPLDADRIDEITRSEVRIRGQE
ncbi:hypothetical protein G9C85_13930 [Halorubellus sp. JP-L1]|uniref:hypothetical protein n=1 Tax=Halorubellus sp. JP-L1 TaxID=2715753 RepID=UPI0014077DDE|nr:hypothetical protein [Halorubellus sp. JP-L1]NHN42721.1 hypothetical protein [Halorubellus sp. JP-L1]